MMLNKHVLALAAAGAMALGTTSVSAAPVLSNSASLKAASPDHATQVRYKRHRSYVRVRPSQDWGPFGAPAAAAAGVGAATGAVVGGALATTGAIVGGTTAAVTGYPYGPYAYGSYAYAPHAYGAYAYAPGAYGVNAYAPGAYGYGLGADRGHQFYNGVAAPASQGNRAIDGGLRRFAHSQL